MLSLIHNVKCSKASVFRAAAGAQNLLIRLLSAFSCELGKKRTEFLYPARFL